MTYIDQEKNIKRKKEIKFRVSGAEYAQLLKRCDRPSLAPWIRDLCLGVKPSRKRTPPNVDPALLRQLAGIGNNINQIARQINTVDTFDGVVLLSQLFHISEVLQQIRNDHSDS